MKEEFVKRLEEEVQDLDQKLEKLLHFMQSKDYINLTDVERFLLEEQFNSMKRYLTIIRVRLSLYEKSK